MSDVNTLLEIVEDLKARVGWGASIFLMILILILFFFVNRLKRQSEIIVEEASEKTLKKYQSELEKELVKFQTKHHKQIDAIHNTYQLLQSITLTIQYLLEGENFTTQDNPRNDIQSLIELRHGFKKHYNINKLLFSKSIHGKIDKLIPLVDEFVKSYESGLMPEQTEEEREYNSE